MGSTAPFLSPRRRASAERQAIYYLVWRSRANHPWHSEEYFTRIEAHKRYFTLLDRGSEAYLECRRQPNLSA